MEQLLNLLNQTINENMLRMTLSGKRHAEMPDKVKIRPVQLKGQLYFQTCISDGKKEFHKNYPKEELLEQIGEWMRRDYRQLQMDTTIQSVQAMVSKKGKATIKQRIVPQKRQAKPLEHNRKKRYLLEEGTPVPFLVDLGVLDSDETDQAIDLALSSDKTEFTAFLMDYKHRNFSMADESFDL